MSTTHHSTATAVHHLHVIDQPDHVEGREVGLGAAEVRPREAP